MHEILAFSWEILIRSVVSIAVLFILTKLMGVKQIAQLTFFDYVIGISIGSIAADIAADIETGYLDALCGMVIYAAVAILISFLSRKSIKARRLLTGVPVILIDRGKILKENLKAARFDLNELLCECRVAGYFNIADLAYAIMEPDGRLSFIPKAAKKPVLAEDLSLSPEQEQPVANVIIDGKPMPDNLRAMGRNEDWLYQQLKAQGIKQNAEILLATLDHAGCLSVYLAGGEKKLCILE